MQAWLCRRWAAGGLLEAVGGLVGGRWWLVGQGSRALPAQPHTDHVPVLPHNDNPPSTL